jgi:PAS domain S-box-containing protein
VVADEQFWKVFQTSVTPMLVVGDDAVYRDVNDAVCRELGRSREDIVGRHAGLFTPADRRDDVPDLWRTFMRRRVMALQWPLRLGSGEVRDVPIVLVADMAGPGQHVIAHLEGRPRVSPLSPREQEITRLLAAGLTGEEIARELWISPETVRTHIRNAKDSVGARTRSQLVARAVSEHLMTPLL